MKTNSEIVNGAMEAHFSILKQRVRNRLKSGNSLDWLLDSQASALYQPDYLTMASVGRTRALQVLNNVIAHVFPRLWFKTFWSKISKNLISFTEESYYQKMFHEVTDVRLVTEIQEQISDALITLLSQNWDDLRHCTFTEISNCLVPIIHEPLRRLPIEQDIFLPDKKNQNAICLDLLKQIKDLIRVSDNRLEMMAYLCCRSNWIDSLEDDVAGLLERFAGEISISGKDRSAFIKLPPNTDFFQLEKFKKLAIATSGPVLYEADNCGEIVFDLYLIDEFIRQGRTVYLCVKGVPMVNDAMEKDVIELLEKDLFAGLKQAYQQGSLKIITAGAFPGGGKLVHEISDNYRQAYVDSDLVIVKGQGNFQSMPMGTLKKGRFVPYIYKKPIVFMTGIKAEIIKMCLTVLSPKNRGLSKTSLLLYVSDTHQALINQNESVAALEK